MEDSSARWPADVYIPRWRHGPPAALDFAVTSGMRADMLALSRQGADHVCAHYEDFKESYRNTKRECQTSGISFIPCIVEAVGGGWGREARRVWKEVAKFSAIAAGDFLDTSDASL